MEIIRGLWYLFQIGYQATKGAAVRLGTSVQVHTKSTWCAANDECRSGSICHTPMHLRTGDGPP